MKIVKKFQMKIVIFTAVKNRCILHGRVFVMSIIPIFLNSNANICHFSSYLIIPILLKSNANKSS